MGRHALLPSACTTYVLAACVPLLLRGIMPLAYVCHSLDHVKCMLVEP
jgi:hypothetical protein